MVGFYCGEKLPGATHGGSLENTDHGTLRFGKAYELDTDPDDAIWSRSCVSHVTLDRHIDGGAEIEAHRNTTSLTHLDFTVLPHTEKFDWIGVAKFYPESQRRGVDNRALPPLVRWLAFDMASAHTKRR
jgi:hypothetical protein